LQRHLPDLRGRHGCVCLGDERRRSGHVQRNQDVQRSGPMHAQDGPTCDRSRSLRHRLRTGRFLLRQRLHGRVRCLRTVARRHRKRHVLDSPAGVRRSPCLWRRLRMQRHEHDLHDPMHWGCGLCFDPLLRSKRRLPAAKGARSHVQRAGGLQGPDELPGVHERHLHRWCLL
jgi:hypothetical protein